MLKDADATAIYGSRGANGVVLITTKNSSGEKIRFTLSAQSGLGGVANTQKLLNTTQYLEMRRQAFSNDGMTEYPPNAYDINGTWDQNRYTDWQKILLALTQIKASGRFPDTQAILAQLSAVRKNGLIVVISDFHQLNNELFGLTAKLSHRHSDVVAFHLDSDDEINFPCLLYTSPSPRD